MSRDFDDESETVRREVELFLHELDGGLHYATTVVGVSVSEARRLDDLEPILFVNLRLADQDEPVAFALTRHLTDHVVAELSRLVAVSRDKYPDRP